MHTKAPEHGTPPDLLRYGIALLSVVIAAFLTFLLLRWSYPGIFLFFFAAVVISAWLGGFGPALVATVLSAFASTFFFPPSFHLPDVTAPNVVRLGLFVLISLLISWLGAARKRSEAARRGFEQHYRLLFERNLAGVFLSTLDGLILDCNESFARIVGYDSREEVLTHHASDFYFETAPRKSYLELLQKEGSVTTYEVCMRGKHERPVWVLESVSLLNGDDGAQALLQGTMIEITDRKREEDELRKQKEILQAVFDHAPVMMSFYSEDGHVKMVNREWERTRGWTLEEIEKQDQDVLAMSYPDAVSLQQVREFITEATGEWRDFKTRMKDGRVINTTWAVVPLSDGTRVCMGRDITERKRAEEALRESEVRYRNLFENAHDAIYVHDLNGNYISVNRAGEQLAGYSRDEIIGKNIADFIAPKYLNTACANLKEKLDGRSQTAYEIEVIARDGHSVPVEISSRLIYENDVAVGVQGVARDISDRKRAEEALRTFPRRLIGAQEAERRRVARELHDEIGQALTAIKINLQNLQHSRDVSSLAQELIESNCIVDSALQHVRDLSGDLRPSLLDDLGLVAALRWYVEREARRAGLTLDLNIDLSGIRLAPEIETACFRIAQEAFTNTIRHAQAKRVKVDLGFREADLKLVIRDDGVGFDVGVMRHGLTSEASLGLQGMQERVHAVGGRIEIDSARALGTEIRVQLPFIAYPSSTEDN